jgi:hypothetical protein
MVMVLQAAVLQLLLPCFLLWWMQNAATWIESCVRFVVCVMYFWIIRYATLWLVLPVTSGPFYLRLAIVLLLIKFFRAKVLPEKWPATLRSMIPAGLLSVIFLAAIFYLQKARQVDDKMVVTLAYPFASGKFYVVNGGALALLNAHHLTLGQDERFDDYKGQSYGVDMVATNQYGMVSSGVLPRDPDAYSIFGMEVLAPCAGVVRSVENSLQDLPAGERDRTHMEGNHVLLGCDGFDVLLAHLQQGSVVVRAGQNIAVGRVVGKAGNTGNTDLPHLHIHAQKPSEGTAISAGEPLQIRFVDRYLVRGDIVNL